MEHKQVEDNQEAYEQKKCSDDEVIEESVIHKVKTVHDGSNHKHKWIHDWDDDEGKSHYSCVSCWAGKYIKKDK